MASTYPTALDTFATDKADSTVMATDHAAHHNSLADAINKIEAELGTSPSATYSTVTARLAFLDSRGSINLDAVLDGSLSADSTWAYRLSMGLSGTNGVNSTRGGAGDAITSDFSNSAGASFFFPIYTNDTIATQGSWANYAGYLTVSDASDGGTSKYREGNILYGYIDSNSKGALTAPIEIQNVIASAKPARATGMNILVTEANALAAYTSTIFGAGSPWITTGARGLWLVSNGAAAAGTGLYVDGTAAAWTRGVFVNQASATGNALATRALADTVDRFTSDVSGKEQWGSGTAVADITLERNAAGQLKLSAGSATASALLIAPTNATDFALGARAAADSVSRLVIYADGKYELGDGTAVRDTNLYRSAANRLKTDDLVDATGMGVATFVKAGTPSDADWAVAPPVGTLVVDTTGNKIWARTAAATWKGVAIA
jgi:hypothetical protein